jgi:arylsulfatase A
MDGALEKNGDHQPAGPFSGGKYSVYEGGTRTPLITRWPGRIRPGISDQIVCTIDLAASLASITGQALADDACLDSFDLSAALLGQPDAKGRDQLVQQDNGTSGTFGFRSGPWKLHRHDGKTARNVDVRTELANSKVPRFRLFNLDSDPGEKDDLLASHPEIAERLKRQLDEVITRGRSR